MTCPDCGAKIEPYQELFYENENDPTPEYGGKLENYTIIECSECGYSK